MDEYLCIFTSKRSEFFTRVTKGLIELNSFVAGMIISCKSCDVGENLDFFEGLYLIYTNPEFDELKSSVSLKFFQEISAFLQDFDETKPCVGEIFCKFCQKFTVPCQSDPAFSNLSQVFGNIYGLLMRILAKNDLFPVLLKLSLKHKKLLINFEKCIDDDLVNTISDYSKVHYLDDIEEFKLAFERVIEILNKKNRNQLSDAIEYVASKLINYLSHQKNEDTSGIVKVYMENKSIFSQVNAKKIEEFIKLDTIFTKLSTVDRKEKSLDLSENNSEGQPKLITKKSDESKTLKLEIKVLSKPYEEEDYQECKKPSVSFFENYDYRSHSQYNKVNDASHRAKHETKDKPNYQEPKKKYYRKKNELENLENKDRVLGEEEKNNETELKKSIRDAILSQEQIFFDLNLINAATLSQELKKLSLNPGFSSLLFSESMTLLQEQEKKKNSDFWKAAIKVLKNLLDSNQIEKLKSALNTA